MSFIDEIFYKYYHSLVFYYVKCFRSTFFTSHDICFSSLSVFGVERFSFP